MQVLHLIDDHPASSSFTALALLADIIAHTRDADVMHHVISHGRAPLDERIRSMGLPLTAVLRPGEQWALRGWRALREQADFDVLHTLGGRPVVSYSVAPVQVMTDPAGPDLAVDPARLGSESRAGRRGAWGVSDETLVVAALGDPPGTVDAMEALLGIGLARETGRDVVMLISDQAPGLERARHIVRSVRRGRSMIIGEAVNCPWRVLAACDAAVSLTGGLSAAWAMVAGLPIVASHTVAAAHQLQDDRTALLAASGKLSMVARQVCRLLDDLPLRQRLGDAARREALQRYSPPSFAAKWLWRCENAAGLRRRG